MCIRDRPPILVGERCNANGSKKFKELLLIEDYDGMAAMAKEQTKDGAHFIDVCVAVSYTHLTLPTSDLV